MVSKICLFFIFFTSGIRKERGNYRNPQMRRVTRLSSQDRTNGPSVLTGPAMGSFNAPHPPELTSEQLIERILEAEPPEIYLMKDMRRPLTEANVMMSLTNLADKELVHMISWAKKIPGVCRGTQGSLKSKLINFQKLFLTFGRSQVSCFLLLPL